MNKQEISSLNVMRSIGKTTAEIASALRISINTVRSYVRRYPPADTAQSICRYCGKAVLQTTGRKMKLFCSDKCRNAWWKKHPESIERKAYYRFSCEFCGKEYESYGNNKRKYCSRACYANSRKAHTVSDASGSAGHDL